MRRVAAGFAPEFHRRVAGARRSLEALVPGPRLDQRAAHGEMLVREQVRLARLGQHPLAVLREHAVVPDRIVHLQPPEPAQEQVVVELLHQQPLAADRVQHLQQQRAQQLLRRDRRPAGRRVQRGEAWRQLRQDHVHHLPHRPQRMVLRHSGFGRDVTPHRPLRLIVTPLRASSRRVTRIALGPSP